MDADFIRLILLILGIALVAGIWLWDRWHRGRGEPPMVRLREQDVAPSAHEDEYADEEDEELPRPEFEPHEDVSLYLDADDGDDDFDVEHEAEQSPRVPPMADDSESLSLDEEAATPTLKHQPAWVRPSEPVIPAFVMAAASQPLTSAPQVRPHDDKPKDDKTAAAPAKAATGAEPVSEPVFAAQAKAAGPAGHEKVEPSLMLSPDLEPEIPVLELAPEPAEAVRPARAKAKEAPKPKPEAEPINIRLDEDQIDLDLGFSAVDDQDLQDVSVELPDLIVQINIIARSGAFSGEQILAAMDQVEMRAGEHNIFHRYDNQGKRKSLFSLASLVEPGTFPLKKMKDFSTPGLTLFAQLPGPRDGLLVYSDMLYVAERLARLLDARLKDDSRSTLTKQTVEHTRERIAEHKRQITLKLRKAGDKQRGRR